MSSEAAIEKMPPEIETCENGRLEPAESMNEKATSDEDDVSPEAIGGTLDRLPSGYYRSPGFIGTILALCFGSIASYLGWVLPSNLLGIINEDIGPDPNYVWMATAWTLAVAVCSLLWGRLSDIFGRRYFLIGGNVVCLIGAIMGSVAKNITTLIWANAFVGLAVPAQLGFTIAIAELIPNKWRGYMNALMFCASLPFAMFGTVIGRALETNTAARWRWCYYLNAITSACAVLLFVLFYHPPSFDLLHTRATKMHVLKTLDYLGICLFTAGLALFLLGINWGGQQYPWTSGETLGTVIGGLALLVAFGLWEIFGAKSPLVPMRLFRNRGYVGVIFTAAAGSMIYYSLSVLWPEQISVLYSTDPITIGWMSCTVGASTLVGQLIGGALVRALGKQKWQMAVCAVCMTALIGAMASTTQHTPKAAITLTCLGSVFVGYIEICSLTNAPLCVDDAEIGLATGVLSSVRTALAGIALSIYSSVLANKLTTNIPKYVMQAATAAGLPASSVPALIADFTTGSFSGIPGVNATIIAASTEAYKSAYSASFRVVYLISITFGGLAVIAALCSPNLESSFSGSISRRLHATGLTPKHGPSQSDAGNQV